MCYEKMISVIILAHKRTEYISRALESVLAQSLDKRNYEVIIVKNFNDPNFDELAMKCGVIVINSTKGNLGGKIVQGIRASSGDFIALLEDDDEFLPGKLEKALKEFVQTPDLIYFHNSAKLVSRGEINRKTAMSPPKTMFVQGVVSRKQFNILIKAGSYGNNSCLTIRKSFVENYLDSLEMLNVTVDGFLFLSALDEGKSVKFDKSAYTNYHADTGFTYQKSNNLSDYVSFKFDKTNVMLKEKRLFVQIANKNFKNRLLLRFSVYSLMKEILNFNLFSDQRIYIGLGDIFRYILESLYFGNI